MLFYYFSLLVLDDLDFYIGEEAILHKTTHPPVAPIRHGLVEDWDMMERFYEQALFKYLRCEPEEHNFMIVCTAEHLM